jgi:hypothetical protein
MQGGLSYDTMHAETDARFRLRLTEQQQRKYDGLRKPAKKQHFRSKWYARVTSAPRESSIPRTAPRPSFEATQREHLQDRLESAMMRARQPTLWEDEDEMAEQLRVEERVREAQQEHDIRVAVCEEVLRKRVDRRTDAPRKGTARNAARKYWALHRTELEARYGVTFAIVFQWKQLVCLRMTRGYHGLIEVPKVPFKRRQWEACAAASLKTCVFRAFDVGMASSEAEVAAILEHDYQHSRVVPHVLHGRVDCTGIRLSRGGRKEPEEHVSKYSLLCFTGRFPV